MTKPLEPGCLALVVQGHCSCKDCRVNNGKVVTVIQQVPAGSLIPVTPDVSVVAGSPMWICQGNLVVPHPFLPDLRVSERPLHEERLVRIDNPDGQDETLTWTPVPTGVTA